MNDLFDIGVGIDVGEINRFKELPKSGERNELVPFENAADRLLGRIAAPRKPKNFGK